MRIHVEGFVCKDDGCISINDEYDSIANLIAEKISPMISSSSEMENGEEWVHYSVNVKNVFFRYYISDAKIPLEDIQEKYLVQQLGGAMDILTEDYGYSEWTIMGCTVENFNVAGHDIENELSNYIGKYIHILIDIKEEK